MIPKDIEPLGEKTSASLSDVIVNLNRTNPSLERFIERILTSPFCHGDRYRLRKMKNFFLCGSNKKIAWQRWLAFTGKLSRHSQPEKALAACSKVFDRMLTDNVFPEGVKNEIEIEVESPFSEGKRLFYELSSFTKRGTFPVSKRIVGADDDDRCRVFCDNVKIVLGQSMPFHLMGEDVTILIGGSAGAGKSTLAASLFEEFDDELESLKSWPGNWSQLGLAAQLVSLDAATEVAESIREKIGQDRSLAEARKRPWTVELAREAVVRAEKIRTSGANLIVSDLPGKITNITQLLSVRATFGLIIGPANQTEWDVVKDEWTHYFESIGVPVIGLIKSTKGPSMLSLFKKHRRVVGRVNNLARLVTGGDAFIIQSAKLLLFDIMPGYMIDLHEAIEHQAIGLESGSH